MLARRANRVPTLLHCARLHACLDAIDTTSQVEPNYTKYAKPQYCVQHLSTAAGSAVRTSGQLKFSERSNGQDSPNIKSQSINPAEVAKFAELASEWWNPHGAFRPLHAMNPVRCKFLREALCECFRLNPQQAAPFKDLSFLDVGCGGGILTEALARMGANITGIEPNQENISAAIAHAHEDPVVAQKTKYLAVTAEELASTGTQFDAVMGLEIIEHVDQPQQFLTTLASLTKSDGALFISTINRTPRAYALAVLGAEYVAGILPKGTHDWNKFVTPEELFMLAEGTGLELEQLAGMVFNPLSGRWLLSSSSDVNYIAYFSKTSLADRLKEARQPGLNSKAADIASA